MNFPFQLTKSRNKYRPLISCVRFYRYYVVLPEVPKCTPEENSLLKAVKAGDFPPLKSISTTNAMEATAKLALDFESFSSHHAESFDDVRREKTCETVFSPLNEPNVMMDFAWGTLRQKMLTHTPVNNGTEWIDMRINLRGMNNLIRRCTAVQYSSEPLYRAAKEVAGDTYQLDEWQKRLAHVYVAQGKLNCLEYRKPIDKLRFEEWNKKVILESQNFWLNTQQSCIEPDRKAEAGDLNDLPSNFRYNWSINKGNIFNGPYRLTLDTNSYKAFLTYCSHPVRRHNCWYYWNTRASFVEQTTIINNALKVTELREFRHEMAKIAGFDSFSDLSLSTKMARSLEEVDQFITLMREKCSAKFQRRLKEMNSFAQLNDQLSRPLKPWDYNFYARKLIEFETRLSSVDVAKYFPFDKTWCNLMKLIERLFDVRFVDVTDVKKMDLIDERCRVYCAVDKNTQEAKGYLYFDPFVRLGKDVNTWVDSGRARNKQLNYLPIVYVNADVCPDENGELFLSLDQLCSLSKCLGRALMQVLCESPYFATFSTNNMERDVSFVTDEVFKWIALEPTILSRLTDGQLNLTDAEKIRQIYVESSLPRLIEDTFLSEFDLTIHKINMYWFDLWKQMYESYYRTPVDRANNFPCSFSAIMVDGFAAAYYSKLWSEMVACDIVSAFREAGFENESTLTAVGKKYRETYLTIGGGRHARDVFKLFRNRDIEFNHLLKFYTLE